MPWRTDTGAMRRTVFADLEQLVCVPSDDAALESTPAPFRDARNDLVILISTHHVEGGTARSRVLLDIKQTHHRLGHAKIL